MAEHFPSDETFVDDLDGQMSLAERELLEACERMLRLVKRADEILRQRPGGFRKRLLLIRLEKQSVRDAMNRHLRFLDTMNAIRAEWNAAGYDPGKLP